jgi:hypothetical protein
MNSAFNMNWDVFSEMNWKLRRYSLKETFRIFSIADSTAKTQIFPDEGGWRPTLAQK